MADKYLNDEQMNQFLQNLGGDTAPTGGNEDGSLPPEAQESAMVEGAQMAEADMAQAAGVDAPAAPANGLDPAVLQELGVGSVEELVERYRETSTKSGEYRDMLTKLIAFQQTLENKQELDPGDPLNSVKEAIRTEMAPLYEELSRSAQNKLVQEAWGEAARGLPGVTELIPEIALYIKEHPDLAVSKDGLQRAYDGVRSQKYKSPDELLNDDAFIQQAASNEKVKEAVLREHLGELARNGEAVPPTIGEGGGTPLTGAKQKPSSMEQAKRGLLSRLGGK